MTGQFVLGIDIGGTFTDLAIGTPAHGVLRTRKVLTDRDDPVAGIIAGTRRLLSDLGIVAGDVGRIVHATTLATNVVLEREGARIAFVTTEGFGDLPFIGRESRVGSERFDLFWERPHRLIEPGLAFEVPERLDPRGNVVRPLDERAAERTAARLAELDPTAIAVCLLHAYANPEHELRMASVLGAHMPQAHIALSSQVWPEFREFDRAMTTVVSAYVAPVILGYLGRLAEELGDLGITPPLQIMQSNGGTTTVDAIATRPIFLLESGPAAGVVAAQSLAEVSGGEDVVSFDMGGTTAKVGLIRHGRLVRTTEFYVGGAASGGPRRKGGGIPVRLPVIDLVEVGAGGGSIAWIDPGGLLHVGPASAGARPGPACYGFGATEPTVTDADLVLGYIDRGRFMGGELELDVDASLDAIEARVARPLGMDAVEAASAIHDIANANMAMGIRMATVQRGIDPSGFVLCAFGGAGPVHVVRVCDQLGIHRVVVPQDASVMSATGLIASEAVEEAVQTRVTGAGPETTPAIVATFEELERRAGTLLQRQGVTADAIAFSRAADIRHVSQSHSITVAIDADGPITERTVEQAVADFFAAYRLSYGIASDGPVEFVNFRVRATGGVPRVPFRERRAAAASAASRRSRPFYDHRQRAFVEVPVFDRGALPDGEAIEGPCVVEDAYTTAVVPGGCNVRADARWGLVIDVGAGAPGSGPSSAARAAELVIPEGADAT